MSAIMDMRPFVDATDTGGTGTAHAAAWRPSGSLPGRSSSGYARSGEVYGRQRPRWSVLAFILCLHGVALAALLTAKYQVERPQVERLQTFSLTAPEPPPPPSPAEIPPEPVTAPSTPVTAPPTPIDLPRPAPVRAVRPNLANLAVAPVQVALPVSAAPASPAPRPAPPAPVTPPDFSAGQLANPGPSYPYLSRKAHEEGVVTLRVLVSADGHAKQLSVERSSGFERLDEEALKTVRRWRFLPARRAGEAVEAWVLVPVTFALG